MKKTLVAVVLAIATTPTWAQQIYKCAGPNWTSEYQQKPCASGAATRGVRSYTPEPDSKPQTNFRRADAPIRIGRTDVPISKRDEAVIVYEPSRAVPPQASAALALLQGPEKRSSSIEETPLQDQYGNRYLEIPGSSYVRNERTGQLCFTYGSEKQFVNRCD